MKIFDCEFADLKIVEVDLYHDNRGFFSERFNHEKFSKLGLPTNFLQDNFSRSKANVIRGMHFQYEKPQGKLVGCLRGKIIDVVIDLRANSKTFGQYFSIELSDSNGRMLWVPQGFAHGFCVPSDCAEADVLYKVDASYNPKGESGIAFNDKDINIDWTKFGVPNPVFSTRDTDLPSFKSYLENKKF